MQCVILAGGLGTRINSITQNKIPKCLIEINNKPFIDYQLKLLSKNGITKVVLCISHLGHLVREYVKYGKAWNITVEYVEDGPNLIGTGGALRKAFDENRLDEDFFVLYGDSFLPINFKEVYDNFHNNYYSALMTYCKINDPTHQNNISQQPNDRIYYCKNVDNPEEWNIKFNYIDYGLSALKKKIIEQYIPPEQKFDLSKLFRTLSQSPPQGAYCLFGHEIKERFYEIGSVSGINDFKQWLDNHEEFNSP